MSASARPAAAADSFERLPLAPQMLANLASLGYSRMTAIQAASLPAALLGKDLIAQAKTGSGKTAAFALALLANLNARRFAVQALVLCPTRELADQVSTEIRRLARAEENIKLVTLCGGIALRGQTASLGHGAHIVVGTPGRILDHLERGNLELSALNTLVLDEADRMLDMGFAEDIAQVARQCPAQRQTLLFSATYPDGIAQLARQFMREPRQVTVQAQHEAGKIRILAVSGAKRSALDGKIPTFKESGLDLAATGWNTFFAPMGMPKAQAERLAGLIHEVMKDPDTQRKFETAKMEPVVATMAQTEAMLKAYRAQWAPVVQRSGFKP